MHHLLVQALPECAKNVWGGTEAVQEAVSQSQVSSKYRKELVCPVTLVQLQQPCPNMWCWGLSACCHCPLDAASTCYNPQCMNRHLA